MYFVAIVCPPPLNEKVLQFKNWMKDQFGCVAALKSPAHITLIPPFWLDDAGESELLQVLQSFTSDVDELLIQTAGFSHFRKGVLFIAVKDNPDMEQLKKQAETHFVQSFDKLIKQEDRPFHPHITIANRDMKLAHFEKAWEHFSTKKFDETFLVKTISLLKLNPGKWNVISGKSW